MIKILFSAVLALSLTGCLDLSSINGAKKSSKSGKPQETSEPNSGTNSPGSVAGSAPKTDHQVGNGGGGVCLGGDCKTLAEAGVKIDGPEEIYYNLSTELSTKVKETLNRLPLASYRETLLKKIMGVGKTYRVVEVVDTEKLESIRLKYASVLQEITSTVKVEDVEIFAFAGPEEGYSFIGEDSQTYLLPKFFQLSLEQQAKILIHEANVKIYSNDLSETDILRLALEFDGLAQDLLNDPTLILNKKFRIDRWEELCAGMAHELKIFRPSSRVNWIAWLFVNKGLLFEGGKAGTFSTYSLGFEASKIAANYTVPPAFLRLFKYDENFSLDYKTITNWKNILSEETAINICQEKLQGAERTMVAYPVTDDLANIRMIAISCQMINQMTNPEIYIEVKEVK